MTFGSEGPSRSEPRLKFRDYESADRATCLALFDANCPTYFAPNERSQYDAFLAGEPKSYSLVCCPGRICGAFGVRRFGSNARLDWIMIDPAVQGRGIGSSIMAEVLQRSMRLGCSVLDIAASHLSAPFFARFRAQEVSRTKDGWGPDMHRVDMVLPLVLVSS
jgi:GNAT superfamily N-acetyltransferase